MSFPVPATNVDGQKPADIGAVEVYAVTSAIAPATEEQRELATLIATLPVRPIMPEPPVPANGSAPPPIPLPPGVDRGAAVAVREALDRRDSRAGGVAGREAGARRTDAGRRRETADRTARCAGADPAAAAALFRDREEPARPRERAVDAGLGAARSRKLGAGRAGRHQHRYRADDHLAAVARRADIDVPAAADGEAGRRRECHAVATSTPRVPAPLLPLAAKSLGFNSDATTYHVYDVTPPPTTRRAGSRMRSRCRRRSRRRHWRTPSS